MKKIFLSILVVGVMAACQSTPEEATQEAHQPKEEVVLKDYGANPTVINIEDYTLGNENFRTAIWTGEFLQLTVMSIPVGGEIGLEMHDDIEQFLRIEQGVGEVLLGDAEDNLTIVKTIEDDDVVFIPLGVWHNVVNKGDVPLKLYSIYAKPEHAYGTVHVDKAASDADHHHHH